MNLIIVERSELSDTGDVTLTDARAMHMVKVLKVAPGHQVRIGMLEGPRGTGTVRSAGDGTIALRCEFEPDTPPRPRVDLLLAVPRPKVMRRLWAQIAALGVGRIILTNAERVERHYFDTHILAPDTYRPLLVEGLQQALDTRLPAVSIHRQFKLLIEDHLDGLAGRSLRAVADPGARERVAGVLHAGGDERMLVAIGPEGGWNAFEISLLEAHGFRLIGMGPRTLRTDTACVALLTLVHDAMRPRA